MKKIFNPLLKLGLDTTITSIAELSGTKAEFNTSVSDGTILFVGDAPTAHASTHAVGAADTIFPADPGADKYLMWDDDPGELVWSDSGGGASQLSDLSDVVSATNTNRFVLVANGTTGYVGRALLEADISDLGTYATTSQTFYIGTTQVAINRASAALTLAGITLTTPDIGTPSAGNLANCTFPTLNQSTSGTAAIATTATLANEATDATCFPVFATTATGNLGLKTNSGLSFDSSTATLKATKMNIDSNTLSVNEVTDNVGIGTNSPAATERLHVNLASGHYTAMIKRSVNSYAYPVEIDNSISSRGFALRVLVGTTEAGYKTFQVYSTNGDYMYLTDNGNMWMSGQCSALSFDDRTPFYDGDALTEIKKIKGKDGEIDHSTLPEFVKSIKEKKVNKDGSDFNGTLDEDESKTTIETTIERNIGNMISMNVKAIQQLLERIEKLEAKSNNTKT